MIRTASLCCLVVASTVSCVAAPEISTPPAKADVAHSKKAEEESQSPRPTKPSTQGRKSRLTKAELQIWNDPEFQRRLVESYKAETEIEPRVTGMNRLVGMYARD